MQPPLAWLNAPAAITLVASLAMIIGTSRLFRAVSGNPLDAIAATTLTVGVALFGIFAVGNLTAGLSTPLLDAMLTANPVVAVASAADVDIFHGAFLYDHSPVAHREFHYPYWPVATVSYSAVAIVTYLAAVAVRRMRALPRP